MLYYVGWVRFLSVAKKPNPPILQNVGLRYRASLEKLTQPTTLPLSKEKALYPKI